MGYFGPGFGKDGMAGSEREGVVALAKREREACSQDRRNVLFNAVKINCTKS